MYNTITAELIAEDSYSNPGDFRYWHEALYKKKTGEYFLYGEGGPLSMYRTELGLNSWDSGENIQPLSVEEAKKWAEQHSSAEEYIKAFGEPEE